MALLFLDHGTRRGWGVSVTPRPLFTPGKDPVPIVQDAPRIGILTAGAEILNEERNRNHRADNMNDIRGYTLLRNEDFVCSKKKKKLSEFYIKRLEIFWSSQHIGYVCWLLWGSKQISWTGVILILLSL